MVWVVPVYTGSEFTNDPDGDLERGQEIVEGFRVVSILVRLSLRARSWMLKVLLASWLARVRLSLITII